MQFIINTILKNGLFILFVFLEIIALSITFKVSSFHQSVWGETSTKIVGSVDQKINNTINYVHLNDINKDLQVENSDLRKQLAKLKSEKRQSDTTRTTISNINYRQKYTFFPVDVINNSIIKTHNYITIDKGFKQGVKRGMGVISGRGIIGLVYKTTDNFSRVISLLNTNVKVNARLKNNYFGTLIWDGKDPRFVQLTEIPKYISVEKNDTVETDGKSPSFPEGIMIGRVDTSYIDKVSGELNIKVRLNEDFTRLRHAQVVLNLDKEEIIEVEQIDSTANAQQ